MKTITIRELRNRPGAAQADIAAEGEVVLTSNGRPVAVMLSVDDSSLDETLQAVHLGRARVALRGLRRDVRERGLDQLTPAQIDDMIRDTRRRKRGRTTGSPA
ncbi:MAG: type II toxin-antitoxin system Phd/YefM family antitoxin [Gammaproteobacteria bacterium]